MSHYTVTKSKITDIDILVKALQDMGFKKEEIMVHDSPENLYGFQGDKRKDLAEVIIPRKYVGGSSNDIGFKRQKDGTFGAIISDFDKTTYNSRKSQHSGNIIGYGENWLNKLAQRYSYNKVKSELSSQGFYLEEEREENGEIFLEITTPYGGA